MPSAYLSGHVPVPPGLRIILKNLITRMASRRRLSLRVFVIPYNAEPAQFDSLKRFDCDCLNLIVE